jgi:N-acetylmuramoyl-L-alanine amidase
MFALLLALSLASADSVQAARLDEAKSRLELLRSDPRRRKLRDGWESILRELDAASRAAPKGARAAEVALTIARVRVELFQASRTSADAKAAFAALRKVDELYPGPLGLEALHEAVQLSWRTKSPGDRAAAAARLVERYPDSAEAKAVAARSAELNSASAPASPSRAEAMDAAIARVTAAPATTSTANTTANSTATATSTATPAVSVPHSPPVAVPFPAVARAVVPAAAPDEDDAEEDEASAPPEPDANEATPQSKSGPILRAVKDAVAAITEPEDVPMSAQQARDFRSTALASGDSVAAQLGLKVRRIVVDAGHGGKDTGAIGPHGVREKDMALSIARKVAARLKALGFTVILTRRDDTFVPLDDRTRIANEAKADLFVSIHCNAARRRKLEGVETWTLNVAADRYATRLAAFENADADRTVSDLRLILADLATRSNASDARELAQSVQSSLVRTLRSRVGKVHDHGVKQALFYVLLGTHMPSILVETGFISNPAEEARLKSAKFQDGTAEAIARGVKDFVDSRRRVASIP